MRKAILKKRPCILKTSSAYKGISLFSEDIDGLIQIDILYVQLISNSSPIPPPPDCTVFTQPKWHIIHQLRKGEAGHMHNFFPLHGFTPPCQRSPWNSTKKTQHWLNDKIVFFPLPLSSWESEAPPKSFHQPASVRRVSRTHCRKHYRHLLSHTRALIPMIWQSRVLEEC